LGGNATVLLQGASPFHQLSRWLGLSAVNWSFKGQISKFIRHFWKEPYKEADRKWVQRLVEDKKIKEKVKYCEKVGYCQLL